MPKVKSDVMIWKIITINKNQGRSLEALCIQLFDLGKYLIDLSAKIIARIKMGALTKMLNIMIFTTD